MYCGELKWSEVYCKILLKRIGRLKCSQRLADAVKKTRLELGLTQEEVADKCDTDVRTIINMEMGRGNPKLKTLFRVVRALKIDARELFDDDPQGDSPLHSPCMLTHQ